MIRNCTLCFFHVVLFFAVRPTPSPLVDATRSGGHFAAQIIKSGCSFMRCGWKISPLDWLRLTSPLVTCHNPNCCTKLQNLEDYAPCETPRSEGSRMHNVPETAAGLIAGIWSVFLTQTPSFRHFALPDSQCENFVFPRMDFSAFSLSFDLSSGCIVGVWFCSDGCFASGINPEERVTKKAAGMKVRFIVQLTIIW